MDKMKLQLFAANTTESNAPGNNLSAEMKTYYEKRLIDLAEPRLVHDQFGDKYPIPVGGGKTIEFRRYDSLEKAVKPITEGVTPAGNSLNVTSLTETVMQYGDWIQLSDMLEMSAVDNNVVQATRLLGAQAGRTLDSITRDVLAGGTNVIYAPDMSDGEKKEVKSRSEISENCRLTADLIFRAAAQLKGMNADPIDDKYVAIIHPYVAYDLMRSEEWIDAHKYATPENIYAGEIGRIAGVRFVESTEAKIFRGADLADTSRTLTVTAYSGSAAITPSVGEGTSFMLTVSEKINTDKAPDMIGKKVLIKSKETGAYAAAVIKGVHPNTRYVFLAESPDFTPASGDVVYPGEGGKDGISVFSTIVLGAHAYAVTEIEGGGLTHIVKQLGYGDDPLNQRSSVGWKATKCAKRLVEQYMVRIESASSYSANAAAN